MVLQTSPGSLSLSCTRFPGAVLTWMRATSSRSSRNAKRPCRYRHGESPRCMAMQELAHHGHLTATARKTCMNVPCHWYLVAIDTACPSGDPDIIPGDGHDSPQPPLRVYQGSARARWRGRTGTSCTGIRGKSRIQPRNSRKPRKGFHASGRDWLGFPVARCRSPLPVTWAVSSAGTTSGFRRAPAGLFSVASASSVVQVFLASFGLGPRYGIVGRDPVSRFPGWPASWSFLPERRRTLRAGRRPRDRTIPPGCCTRWPAGAR